MKNLSLSKLAIPIYFDMLLRLLAVLTNTYMVSKVNVKLVGALGAGNEIFTLFVTIFNFLAVGCSVVVAQALGARNSSLATRAIHVSLTFNLIVGAICGIFVHTNADFLLQLLKVPQNLIKESEEYLKILSIVFFVDAIAILMSALVRVYGYVKTIMFGSAIMNLIIIFGNSIALFQPFGLPFYGLHGIGISTIIGRMFGVIFLSIILFKIIKVRFYPLLLVKFKFDILKKILSVGIPSAGENLLWMLQYLVAFRFVASMGEDPLTVQAIYFQISAFIFFTGSAISIANEVIVGKLVGAKMFDEAYKRGFKALKIGLINTFLMSLIVFLLKDKIMQILNLTDNLKNIMLPLFYLTLVLELGRTLNIIMVNSLRASGDAKFPFLMGVIFMWGVSIPIGWFLGIYLKIGILGVWLGFFCDEWLRGIANTLRWKSKKWQTKRLV